MAFVAAAEAGRAAKGAQAAKAARSAKGTAAAGGAKPPASSSRPANGRTPSAAEMRAGVERIKASRPAVPATPPDEPSTTGGGEASSSSSSSPTPAGLDAVHTGGGVVLAVIAWAVGRNYIEGGMPQVKRLARAKFLNKTGA